MKTLSVQQYKACTVISLRKLRCWKLYTFNLFSIDSLFIFYEINVSFFFFFIDLASIKCKKFTSICFLLLVRCQSEKPAHFFLEIQGKPTGDLQFYLIRLMISIGKTGALSERQQLTIFRNKQINKSVLERNIHFVLFG